MGLSWCTTVAGTLLLMGCAVPPRPAPLAIPTLSLSQLRVKPNRGPARRVALEEYVRGAILSEFDPPSGDPALVERMLEVQAVITRTYAVAHLARHSRDGFDLCSTSHCQLFEPGRLKASMWTKHVDRAAANTAGMVLWYGKAPARTLFHSDCGGHTSAVSDVWDGRGSPYLGARPDDGPAASAHSSWQFAVERGSLARALNRDPRTRVGPSLTDLRIAERDAAGRAARVAIRGSREMLVRGEQLRAVLTRSFGSKSLRSTKFTVERAGNRFVFAGRGYGHGVGLCQRGAYARLGAGERLEQVLARYYPGTRLLVLR